MLHIYNFEISLNTTPPLVLYLDVDYARDEILAAQFSDGTTVFPQEQYPVAISELLEFTKYNFMGTKFILIFRAYHKIVHPNFDILEGQEYICRCFGVSKATLTTYKTKNEAIAQTSCTLGCGLCTPEFNALMDPIEKKQNSSKVATLVELWNKHSLSEKKGQCKMISINGNHIMLELLQGPSDYEWVKTQQTHLEEFLNQSLVPEKFTVSLFFDQCMKE